MRRARSLVLWQPSEPAFWVFTLLVVSAALATLAEQAVFREVSRSGWLLAWLLAVVYALPVLVLILTLDLFEEQPVSLLAAALAWGALPATVLSAIANAGWGFAVARVMGPDAASVWTSTLTAPWVEETLKLCGLVLIYLTVRREIHDLMDGFVYGAIIGLGFSVVEEVFYFMGVFGGQPADVLQGFFLRAVASGFYGHLLYGGLAGMGLAYFVTRRQTRSFPVRLGAAALAFLAAGTAHLLGNSPWLDLYPRRPWSGVDYLLLPLALAVRALPFLLTVGLFVWLSRRRERRWLDLLGDSGPDCPSAAEIAMLRSASARRRAVRDMRRRAGASAAGLLKRLQREQVRMAMMIHRGTSADDPRLIRQRAECRALGNAIRAIPGAALASG